MPLKVKRLGNKHSFKPEVSSHFRISKRKAYFKVKQLENRKTAKISLGGF